MPRETPPNPPAVCFLGLGANLGDPPAQLALAVEKLSALAAGAPRVSSIVRSAPWDGSDQPQYFNLAMEAAFFAEPLEILAMCQGVERALGRPGRHPKWGPRLIDIDLLVMPGRIVREEGLRVPHPLYRERLFAVQPLAEIAPDLRDPETGETMRELFEKLTLREAPLPSGTIS